MDVDVHQPGYQPAPSIRVTLSITIVSAGAVPGARTAAASSAPRMSLAQARCNFMCTPVSLMGRVEQARLAKEWHRNVYMNTRDRFDRLTIRSTRGTRRLVERAAPSQLICIVIYRRLPLVQ